MQSSIQAAFGFHFLPFSNTPDLRLYFPSDEHEKALHWMAFAIQGNKGGLLVTGPAGCGKTLLTRALLERLPAGHHDAAIITDPILDWPDFFAEILHQFGIHASRTNPDAGRRALEERLLHNAQADRSTILFVDEAHTIPNDRVFEGLRLLLNFQLNDRFLLNLCLVGQPEILDVLARHPALDQRLGVRVTLSPFSPSEVAAYVLHRIARAGGRSDLFQPDALEEIARRTGGVPRLVNNLCEACIFEAAQDGRGPIGRPIVERAAPSAL